MGVKTENGIIKPVPPPQKLSAITADRLLKMDLPPVEFIVDKLLPCGLALLVSPPKYGKSWLCLDLGISVASGGYFLGFRCSRHDVLYLALEDSNNRIQDRLLKVLNGKPAPPGLFTAIDIATMDRGFFQTLGNFLLEHQEVKLVIIDTFQKIRGAPNKALSAYQADYQDVGNLKKFADQRGICILLVHHLRKMKDSTDVFSNISGTSGILGACDTSIVLSRKSRSDEHTTLSITGRDVLSEDFSITFDKTTFHWKMVGTADEVERQTEEQKFKNSYVVRTVMKLLQQGGGFWEGTASELLAAGQKLFKRNIATNATQLGKELSRLEKGFAEFTAIEYVRVAGKATGATVHRFSISNPFE